MADAEKVIAELQEYHDREWTDERTYPATQETRKRVTGNAISLLKEQQEEIERLKPKREGRWIPYMPEYGDMFQCDECEYIVRFAFKPQDKKCPYGYCPKCGKRMELS